METCVDFVSTLTFFAFKSYYVVWKRREVSFFLRRKEKFKSYYVVWKPFFFKKKDNQKKGLNRTM